MYNSVRFKIFVIKNNERRLLETAVVENISFNANDVNTASFSMLINSLDAEAIPDVGTKVLIYAYGQRPSGNNFSQNFLNKNLSQYQQHIEQNPIGDYELLLFAGEIQSITSELETNIFAYHFVFRYTFNCVGAEYLLKNLGFNVYKFYDPLSQQMIDIAGIPIFGNNCYYNETNGQYLFTTDGYGDVWTRGGALVYLQQNITSPYSDVVFNINYSTTTFADLENFDIYNSQILSHYDFIKLICGQLFNFYFTYAETENDIIVVNVTIISKASTNANDIVSFLNLHSTKLSAYVVKPPERLVLRYPFYAIIDGYFQIFRHPDNIAGDEYYIYELSKVTDDLEFETVYYTFYKPRGEHWSNFLQVLSNTPIPDKVDYELKHSLGAQMGCHSKFIVHPITLFNINGIDVSVNIEDFEIIQLNEFLRAVPTEQGYELLPWQSSKPFTDMTIRMDGNQVVIDCDIPHQIAPSDFVMPFSQIEKPVFPINDGDWVYIKAIVRSKNNREYVSIGTGIETRIVDVDFVPTEPMVLANYLYTFISNPISSLSFDGILIDWLIDYFFAFGKKINKIYFYAINEGISSQPLSAELEYNIMVSQFNINRNGAYYTFTLEADKGEIDLDEILAQLRFRFEKKEEIRNEVFIKGNFDEVFYGKIIEVKDNHYVVLPEWAENEEDTIDVARIDELKLGYWLNNPPSEKVSFELKLKQPFGYEYSERYTVITNDDGTVRKLNKIVPDEQLFDIIAFKVGSGSVRVIMNYNVDGRIIFKYIPYIDINQYARSWAVVPDDEENVYG